MVRFARNYESQYGSFHQLRALASIEIRTRCDSHRDSCRNRVLAHFPETLLDLHAGHHFAINALSPSLSYKRPLIPPLSFLNLSTSLSHSLILSTLSISSSRFSLSSLFVLTSSLAHGGIPATIFSGNPLLRRFCSGDVPVLPTTSLFFFAQQSSSQSTSKPHFSLPLFLFLFLCLSPF